MSAPLLSGAALSKVTLTVELEPNEAAALMRLCAKFNHSHADAYLYPHVSAEIRTEQSYEMLYATAHVLTALADAGVKDWPWIEHGSAA